MSFCHKELVKNWVLENIFIFLKWDDSLSLRDSTDRTYLLVYKINRGHRFFYDRWNWKTSDIKKNKVHPIPKCFVWELLFLYCKGFSLVKPSPINRFYELKIFTMWKTEMFISVVILMFLYVLLYKLVGVIMRIQKCQFRNNIEKFSSKRPLAKVYSNFFLSWP